MPCVIYLRGYIDLAEQEVRCEDASHAFDIDDEAKQMLAEGLDAIDLTLTQRGEIEQWLAADQLARPWVYRETSA